MIVKRGRAEGSRVPPGVYRDRQTGRQTDRQTDSRAAGRSSEAGGRCGARRPSFPSGHSMSREQLNSTAVKDARLRDLLLERGTPASLVVRGRAGVAPGAELPRTGGAGQAVRDAVEGSQGTAGFQRVVSGIEPGFPTCTGRDRAINDFVFFVFLCEGVFITCTLDFFMRKSLILGKKKKPTKP